MVSKETEQAKSHDSNARIELSGLRQSSRSQAERLRAGLRVSDRPVAFCGGGKVSAGELLRQRKRDSPRCPDFQERVHERIRGLGRFRYHPQLRQSWLCPVFLVCPQTTGPQIGWQK